MNTMKTTRTTAAALKAGSPNRLYLAGAALALALFAIPHPGHAQGVVRAEPIEEKTVPDAKMKLKSAKLSGLFPPGSAAQLVETKILNCHQGVCELVAMQ